MSRQFEELSEWLDERPERIQSLKRFIFNDTQPLYWQLLKKIFFVIDLASIMVLIIYPMRTGMLDDYINQYAPPWLVRPPSAGNPPASVNQEAWVIIAGAASKEPSCKAAFIYGTWRTETNDIDCDAPGADCVSPAGALGPLQFMPPTWANVAEPDWDIMDLSDSSRAACREYERLRLFEQKDRRSFQVRFSGQDGGPVWNAGSDGYAQAGQVWDIATAIESEMEKEDKPSRGSSGSVELRSPVNGPYRVTNYMGPSHPDGVDIAQTRGVPFAVYAVCDGEITFTSHWQVHCDCTDYADVEIAFWHTSPAVSVGDKVSQGDRVGIADGHGGTSTGVHLHFMVIVDGSNVDPLPLIKE